MLFKENSTILSSGDYRQDYLCQPTKNHQGSSRLVNRIFAASAGTKKYTQVPIGPY